MAIKSRMDQDDHPPRRSLAAITASLEQSQADLDAGRVVPMDTVLADLDASIERMEARRAVKAKGAA